MCIQYWSRVDTLQVNTSTDEECDRNVKFQNCRVIWYKRPRIMMRTMSERSILLQQMSTSVDTRLEGVVGAFLVETLVPCPVELCEVSSGYVAGLLLFSFQARANWCSCASVVTFFEQCCDQFVVQFLCPVFSHQHVAQCTLHEF